MNLRASVWVGFGWLCLSLFACEAEIDPADEIAHCIPAAWQGECYEGTTVHTACDGELAGGLCPSTMPADGGVTTDAVASCTNGGMTTVYYRLVEGASESDLNDALVQIQEACAAAGGKYEEI